MKRWTEDEVLVLRRLELNNSEIAKILSRSMYSVRDKRKTVLGNLDREGMRYSRNGFTEFEEENKSKGYTLREKREIVNSNLSQRELAVIYGRSIGAIQNIKRLNKHLKELKKED